MSSFVYINGEVFKPEEAKISVYDRGFLFGDAVYEVTRSYGKILFGLEEHIDRMFRSAAAIAMDLEYSKEKYIQEMYKLFKLSNESNRYIRVQVSRGDVSSSSISIDPKNHGKANIVMYLLPFKDWPKEQYEKGVSLYSSDNYRNSRLALDPNIKSGNYLNNIIALLPMNREKFSDAVLLNSEGFVTEGTTFNFHIVKNGKIISTPDNYDILHGITRQIVFELAEDNGLSVVKKPFRIEDVYAADEAFVTSSTKEVMPVTGFNDKKIGNGLPGAITNQLASLYKGYVDTYCKMAEKKHPWK